MLKLLPLLSSLLKAFVTIQRRGSYKVNLPSDLEIAHTYKGAENPIVMTRTYSTDFICEFDMSNYPFDTQLCSMVFVMKGNTGLSTAVLRHTMPNHQWWHSKWKLSRNVYMLRTCTHAQLVLSSVSAY